MKKRIPFAAVLIFAGAAMQIRGAELAPRLIINEDNDHYFKQKSELMTEAALRAYIDTFADTQVTHFFMCPQGQRTSYRSRVHEAIWDPVNGVTPTNIWCVNCKLLFDKGIDPYHVWIEQCRKRGISPWITMRMNDVHFVNIPDYFRNTTFWRERRDLWRNPDTTTNNWMECAFDYSKEEAYAYHMAVVRELFERYDFDGFETDWLRFPYHLTPGKAFAQRDVLTRFMREVRALADLWAKKRGHPIRISARVASDPDVAAHLGTDAVAWARDGLIELLVASCFFSTADFDIPIERWHARLGDLKDRVPVIPGTDNGFSPYPGSPRQSLDIHLYRGWAEACRYRGANAFYLFNLVYFSFDRPPFRPIIEKGFPAPILAQEPRRHTITYRDALPSEGGFESGAQLPQTTETPCRFVIQTGQKPQYGKVSVITGLAAHPQVSNTVLTVSLNGTRATNRTVEPQVRRYGKLTAYAVRHTFPLSALRDGSNTVDVASAPQPRQRIEWVEIEITPATPLEHVGPPLPRHAVTNRAFTGISSLAVAPNGRLWVTWYAGHTPNEDNNNYVVLSTSGDHGRTWKEVLIADPDGSGPRRTFDPEVWLAPDGKLRWFFTDRKNGLPATDLLWMIVLDDPGSESTAWHPPAHIADGVMMCKPIVLSTGEWALPVCTWYTENSSKMVVSTDSGKTWSVRGGASMPKEDRLFDEHMFVERKDRSIWCLTRTKSGIREAVSTDRGATWSPLEPSPIQHPSARFFITRLLSGNLLLVKHGPIGKKTGRSHLTAFVSRDDGKTWEGGLMLDERNGVSYPDGQQTADGTIYITHDFDRTGKRHILFSTFREEDALAGKPVSGAVRLRQLVSEGSGGKERPQATK
ncbi:MAG TPA: exo-alpha-sialidase [Kiritimatiellia bacterium]|jgi:hypothetical protein|nr:exo-alpha-sialidase [Kiritimatiellia bacterium]HPC49055.1 exo-alpha-sialidase [Kiritimatiellia bacterium]HPW75921.1 exo-alpha-sialidase [Kiritimatiellia bacterium]HRU19692.1 exo-alpha-sialidase [Kiritimatiellia bacterium]